MSKHRHYDSFSLRIERVGGSKFPFRTLQAILPLRRIKNFFSKNVNISEIGVSFCLCVVMSMQKNCRNVYVLS